MIEWKERFCGSPVVTSKGPDDEEVTIERLLSSNEMLTCGGGFFPAHVNIANMKTFRNNFILPTAQYSVLIFKDDGNAVIYSEDEDVALPEGSSLESILVDEDGG